MARAKTWYRNSGSGVTSTLVTVKVTCRENVNVSTQRSCISGEKVYVEQVKKLSLNGNCSDIL